MPGDRQSDPQLPSQHPAWSASGGGNVIDYRSPRVPELEGEPDYAAIARRVYEQMSQEAPPSALFAVVGRMIALLALAWAVLALIVTIAIAWSATGGMGRI